MIYEFIDVYTQSKKFWSKHYIEQLNYAFVLIQTNYLFLHFSNCFDGDGKADRGKLRLKRIAFYQMSFIYQQIFIQRIIMISTNIQTPNTHILGLLLL